MLIFKSQRLKFSQINIKIKKKIKSTNSLLKVSFCNFLVGFRYFLLLNHLRAGLFLLGVQDSRVTKYICTCPVAKKACHAGSQGSIPGVGVVLLLFFFFFFSACLLLYFVKVFVFKENFAI